jgi:hypothetical protein
MPNRLNGRFLGSLLPSGLSRAQPFAPEDHYLQTLAGVTVPGTARAAARARYWVLSRGLYLSRQLSLTNIESKRRTAAIQLALAGWTPFADTAHYIVQDSERATLYAWDRALVRAAQSSHVNEDAAATLDVIPESALRIWRPSDNGAANLQLVPMLDGVSAVVTRAGTITYEQWFANMPNAAEWQNFQRTIGLESEARSAEPLSVSNASAWRREPIGISANQVAQTGSQREWLMVAIAAWLLMIPTIWLLNDWRQIAIAKRDAIARLADTERALDATITSRGAALASMARAEKLSAIYQQPDTLLLFAQTNETLGNIVKAGNIQMTEWDYRASQLRFVLTPPASGSASTLPAGTALIKAFENIPTWRDVQANVDGSRVTVTARIMPTAAESGTR